MTRAVWARRCAEIFGRGIYRARSRVCDGARLPFLSCEFSSYKSTASAWGSSLRESLRLRALDEGSGGSWESTNTLSLLRGQSYVVKLRRMNCKDDAVVLSKRGKDVEQLFPRHVFSIERAHSRRGSVALQDLSPRVHPAAGHVAAHVARRDPHAGNVADAFRLARIAGAVDVEHRRRRVEPGLSEPYRRLDALAALSKGFDADVLVARQGLERSALCHRVAYPLTCAEISESGTAQLNGEVWCRGAELNCLPRPFQGRALPVSYPGTERSQHFRQKGASVKGNCATQNCAIVEVTMVLSDSMGGLHSSCPAFLFTGFASDREWLYGRVVVWLGDLLNRQAFPRGLPNCIPGH